MSKEGQVVAKVSKPSTRSSITQQLKALGVNEGDSIIVHSSLSSIGWVSGGAVAVVQALMDTVTEDGTIVMPTQSGDLSDPSYWQAPPVPQEWWQTIRDTMPAFDPAVTPTRGMGKIVEVFRTFPAVTRSHHPQVSFAAWGKNSQSWMTHHSLDYGLGKESPLQHLYDNDAKVLLIGVGYDSNTSFHLAEYLLPILKEDASFAPIMVDGERQWKKLNDVRHYEDWFEDIGKDFEAKDVVKHGEIGAATVKLFSVKQSVDFAKKWLEEKLKEKEEQL